MSGVAKQERTHRDSCPAWLAWDEPGACNCDRPVLRVPVPQCGKCGRYVAVKDPATRWGRECGEFGVELAWWVESCRHCYPNGVPTLADARGAA